MFSVFHTPSHLLIYQNSFHREIFTSIQPSLENKERKWWSSLSIPVLMITILYDQGSLRLESQGGLGISWNCLLIHGQPRRNKVGKIWYARVHDKRDFLDNGYRNSQVMRTPKFNYLELHLCCLFLNVQKSLLSKHSAISSGAPFSIAFLVQSIFYLLPVL